MGKEPRSDAWWRGMPQERLDQFAEWCRKPKTEATDGTPGSPGGVQHAQEQLVADGVKVSLSQVTRFWSWYRLNENVLGAENFALNVQELLRRNPSLTPEMIGAAGQLAFTAAAANAQDSEEYRKMEYLRLAKETARAKGKKLELDIARFEVVVCERFLEWFSDDKARGIAESAASNADKIAALRKAFFADVDKLAKDSPLNLPE